MALLLSYFAKETGITLIAVCLSYDFLYNFPLPVTLPTLLWNLLSWFFVWKRTNIARKRRPNKKGREKHRKAKSSGVPIEKEPEPPVKEEQQQPVRYHTSYHSYSHLEAVEQWRAFWGRMIALVAIGSLIILHRFAFLRYSCVTHAFPADTYLAG